MAAATHPWAAWRTGELQLAEGGTNITTNSVRFARGLGLQENEFFEGSQVNAFRHALWQAAITQRFGADFARRIGDAHEDDPKLPHDAATAIYPTLARADEVVDLLNNIQGRIIGDGFESSNMHDITGALLTHYRDYGLWVVESMPSGVYRVVRQRLSEEEYRNAIILLGRMDRNGFTKKEK